jgi:hypothetical protein
MLLFETQISMQSWYSTSCYKLCVLFALQRYEQSRCPRKTAVIRKRMYSSIRNSCWINNACVAGMFGRHMYIKPLSAPVDINEKYTLSTAKSAPAQQLLVDDDNE